MKTHVFDISIEQDDDGRWAASCPALPGCATWGKTQEEAIRNIREAVEVYIEDLLESGEALPGAREVIETPAVSIVTA
ncbi:MAG: type II toxin-antitoxin system HicB family antitoxin [Deltaproteobacteria bacterium]|nr:type II toxin-antitoxin system HicB family antitoxin [Deltaproteobacteria bacterium]